MSSTKLLGSILALLLALGGVGCTPDTEIADDGAAPTPQAQPEPIRVAQFNIWQLSLEKIESDEEEAVEQLSAAASILKQIRPDILVLNEIDAHESQPSGLEGTTRRFLERYLATGERPLDFPYLFVAPSNTGRLSGVDLDNDGVVATDDDVGSRPHGNDSFGYGEYPGQYSMALLSRYPIRTEKARTFQTFRWLDLPGHHAPVDWYSPEAMEVFRLSSKSHWDVPIQVGDDILHLLVSHPTPQGFDGDEDRNGRRNFDEIGFWARYLDDEPGLYDDSGVTGGHRSKEPFVIAGDLNASPVDDTTVFDGRNAIAQLLGHPRVMDPGDWMTSEGALAGRAPGPPMFWERSTTGFRDGRRIDYLLPSQGLEVTGGGVFWPSEASDPEGAAHADAASDHRAIWLDLTL